MSKEKLNFLNVFKLNKAKTEENVANIHVNELIVYS